MSSHPLASIGIAIPAYLPFAGSVVFLSKKRSLASWLQPIGAASLMMIVLTHFAKAFDVTSWMHRTLEAIARAITSISEAPFWVSPCFPIGYLANALAR